MLVSFLLASIVDSSVQSRDSTKLITCSRNYLNLILRTVEKILINPYTKT